MNNTKKQVIEQCLECKFYRKNHNDCTLENNIYHENPCKDFEYDNAEEIYRETEEEIYPDGKYLVVDHYDDQNDW